MITEDYVSFEVAKLLKEKGFEVECDYLYVDGKLVRAQGCACNWNDGETLFTDYKNECSAPTLQMAMKWLREVHSLYIDIVTSFSQDGICYTFSCSNTMDLIQGTKGTSYHEYQTHEEACEAAIKYCLENLI